MKNKFRINVVLAAIAFMYLAFSSYVAIDSFTKGDGIFGMIATICAVICAILFKLYLGLAAKHLLR